MELDPLVVGVCSHLSLLRYNGKSKQRPMEIQEAHAHFHTLLHTDFTHSGTGCVLSPVRDFVHTSTTSQRRCSVSQEQEKILKGFFFLFVFTAVDKEV